ncbi:UNVERIFIED_CONTAM: hypothetical protein K2H54_070400 [Gekko kuhli]
MCSSLDIAALLHPSCRQGLDRLACTDCCSMQCGDGATGHISVCFESRVKIVQVVAQRVVAGVGFHAAFFVPVLRSGASSRGLVSRHDTAASRDVNVKRDRMCRELRPVAVLAAAVFPSMHGQGGTGPWETRLNTRATHTLSCHYTLQFPTPLGVCRSPKFCLEGPPPPTIPSGSHFAAPGPTPHIVKTNHMTGPSPWQPHSTTVTEAPEFLHTHPSSPISAVLFLQPSHLNTTIVKKVSWSPSSQSCLVERPLTVCWMKG